MAQELLEPNNPIRDIDGTPKDPLRIIRDHGYSYPRLRVMVGPSGSYGLSKTWSM